MTRLLAAAVAWWNRHHGYVGRHRLPVEPVDWRRELVEVAT